MENAAPYDSADPEQMPEWLQAKNAEPLEKDVDEESAHIDTGTLPEQVLSPLHFYKTTLSRMQEEYENTVDALTEQIQCLRQQKRNVIDLKHQITELEHANQDLVEGQETLGRQLSDAQAKNVALTHEIEELKHEQKTKDSQVHSKERHTLEQFTKELNLKTRQLEEQARRGQRMNNWIRDDDASSVELHKYSLGATKSPKPKTQRPQPPTHPIDLALFQDMNAMLSQYGPTSAVGGLIIRLYSTIQQVATEHESNLHMIERLVVEKGELVDTLEAVQEQLQQEKMVYQNQSKRFTDMMTSYENVLQEKQRHLELAWQFRNPPSTDTNNHLIMKFTWESYAIGAHFVILLYLYHRPRSIQ